MLPFTPLPFTRFQLLPFYPFTLLTLTNFYPSTVYPFTRLTGTLFYPSTTFRLHPTLYHFKILTLSTPTLPPFTL